MYLVDAEAQYRLDPAKGLDPLNQLRTARGLAALAMSDVEKDVTLLDGTKISGLFNAIQEERGREMLAEGTRLYDLKRWGRVSSVMSIRVLLLWLTMCLICRL